jgi:hypothetical protein
MGYLEQKLILLIDFKKSSGKDYPDGSSAIARERLKNKYNPVSATSMVKLEKQLREI